MGRGIVESGLFRSERYGLELRTTDPANKEGEAWIRTDIAPDTDQLATLRFNNGSGEWDIPIYDLAASFGGSKHFRVPIGGTTGFIPMVQEAGAFNAVRQQHNGTWYGANGSLSVIPDSVIDDFESGDVSQWNNAANFSASSTFSWEGTYAGHITGDTPPDTSVSAVSPSQFIFHMRHEQIGNSDRPGETIYNGGTSGTDEIFRIIVDDGSQTTKGNVTSFDGAWYDTGISVNTSTWYKYIATIDWGNDQWDIEVQDINGNTVGTDSNIDFRNSASSFDIVQIFADTNVDAYHDLIGYNL